MERKPTVVNDPANAVDLDDVVLQKLWDSISEAAREAHDQGLEPALIAMACYEAVATWQAAHVDADTIVASLETIIAHAQNQDFHGSSGLN